MAQLKTTHQQCLADTPTSGLAENMKLVEIEKAKASIQFWNASEDG